VKTGRTLVEIGLSIPRLWPKIQTMRFWCFS